MPPMGMQPMGMPPMGMQPVGMQPMGMQPISMQRSDVSRLQSGQILFEMRIDFLGLDLCAASSAGTNNLYGNEPLKARPPLALSSLPPDAWALVVKEMVEWQHLSGFYNCPGAEVACMLSACCFCTMCPCWFVLGGYLKSSGDLMKRTTTINRELAPHGLIVEGDDRVTGGKFLVFRTR